MPEQTEPELSATKKTEVQTSDVGTEICLKEFSLSAGGKPLLVNSNARFAAGQLTLVLGCSGVGKSLLLRILAGLIEPNLRP